jgi:hypothetical protein
VIIRSTPRDHPASGGLRARRSVAGRRFTIAHLNTPTPQTLRRILEYLGSRSRYPGDEVAIDSDAHPLFDVAERDHMRFLLNALLKRGDIATPEENQLATHNGGSRSGDGIG